VVVDELWDIWRMAQMSATSVSSPNIPPTSIVILSGGDSWVLVFP
jgi:hypothetical protein